MDDVSILFHLILGSIIALDNTILHGLKGPSNLKKEQNNIDYMYYIRSKK